MFALFEDAGKYHAGRILSQTDTSAQIELDSGKRVKAKTAHTLNPVPLILYDNISGGRLGLAQTESAGLANIAATVAHLLGLDKHASWADSLLQVR